MADHSRPQADRPALHLERAPLLHRRRDHGTPHAGPTRTAERELPDGELLQQRPHHARHGHGLPLRDADARRIRELPHPAHGRREGHGVPAPERPLALDLRLQRLRPPWQLRRQGRAGERRLDVVHAAVRAGLQPRSRAGPLDPRSPPRSASRRFSAPSTSSSRSPACARRA